MSASSSSASPGAGEMIRLPPHVSRVLFVKHLPFKITAKEMYDVFGKYGAIRQIRLGDPVNKKTRGTAFVVYQDIIDAKSAVDHLSGFAVGGRYLLVMYYQPHKKRRVKTLEEQRAELEALKRKHGLDEEMDGLPTRAGLAASRETESTMSLASSSKL